MEDNHKPGKEGKISKGCGKPLKCHAKKGTIIYPHFDEIAIAVLWACTKD